MDNRTVSRIAAEVLRVVANARADSRMAIVDGYDPETYTARVRIQPENTLTGWLPIQSQFVGPGWGLYFGLVPGTQVWVDHLEGDVGSGQITGAVNDDSHAAPNVPSGECWLVHSSGSFIKLTNDPAVSISSAGKFYVNATGDIDVATDGNVNVVATGKITASSTSEIDMGNLANSVQTLCTQAFAAWAAMHTHPSNGAPPTIPPPTNGLTTILKGN